MSDLPHTTRLTPTRYKELASHNLEAFRSTLAACVVAHVGFVRDEGPMVLPTAFGFDDDHLYLHGSTGSAFFRDMADGRELCISIVSLDGFLYARSAFDSAVHYRSVVVFGHATVVPDSGKLDALRVMAEHLMPGRWDEVRPPTAKELAATMVLAVPLAEASLKILDGPVEEEPDDGEDHSVWAGILPLTLVAGEHVTSALTHPDTNVPMSVARQRARYSG